MRVEASPKAREFVMQRGGRLFVWATDHSCCGGRLTLLDSSTEAPAKPLHFEEIDAGGFTLLLSAGRRSLPDEIVLQLKGRRRQRVEAFWNGCVYVA